MSGKPRYVSRHASVSDDTAAGIEASWGETSGEKFRRISVPPETRDEGLWKSSVHVDRDDPSSELPDCFSHTGSGRHGPGGRLARSLLVLLPIHILIPNSPCTPSPHLSNLHLICVMFPALTTAFAARQLGQWCPSDSLQGPEKQTSSFGNRPTPFLCVFPPMRLRDVPCHWQPCGPAHVHASLMTPANRPTRLPRLHRQMPVNVSSFRLLDPDSI